MFWICLYSATLLILLSLQIFYWKHGESNWASWLLTVLLAGGAVMVVLQLAQLLSHFPT